MRQANYPETLHRFYVINTPWVFQGIYKIAERFLDPVVKSKVWPYLPPCSPVACCVLIGHVGPTTG